MSTTKTPLKVRIIMASMMLLGWVLGFVVLAANSTVLPEWVCYVPIAAGIATALVYKQCFVNAAKDKAIP